VGTSKSVGVLRSAPIVACSRGVGRRVDPRAARNALHVEETEMKMVARFSSPKGTDQPPHSRCVEFDHDDDGSHEVLRLLSSAAARVASRIRPSAAIAQPPALATAIRVGSPLVRRRNLRVVDLM